MRALCSWLGTHCFCNICLFACSDLLHELYFICYQLYLFLRVILSCVVDTFLSWLFSSLFVCILLCIQVSGSSSPPAPVSSSCTANLPCCLSFTTKAIAGSKCGCRQLKGDSVALLLRVHGLTLQWLSVRIFDCGTNCGAERFAIHKASLPILLILLHLATRKGYNCKAEADTPVPDVCTSGSIHLSGNST